MSKLFASLVVGLYALSLNAFAAEKNMGSDCASLKPGPGQDECKAKAAACKADPKSAGCTATPAKK